MSKRVPESTAAIGIDLGTTYSCVAVWFDQHNRVEIIPNQQGNRITPSFVAWNGTHLLVGEAAKNQITRNPKNTAFVCSTGDKKVQSMILSDVTPHSLGIGVKEDDISFLIPKNTPIPTIKEDLYQTRFDNQTAIFIPVFEGESRNRNENIFLDQFSLHGIPPAPAGQQKHKVCFNLDANGILVVSAESLSSGSKNSIRIERSGYVSKNHIKKSVVNIEQ